jgi:hypothetical protein
VLEPGDRQAFIHDMAGGTICQLKNLFDGFDDSCYSLLPAFAIEHSFHLGYINCGYASKSPFREWPIFLR